MMQAIHDSVWMSPGVKVYGRVSIGRGSSLWTYSVIRAECNDVRIGRISNIQDFVMIHVGFDYPTVIGDFCSVTHHATIHGATIEDACMIGINATIMDGVIIGAGSVVAGGAFVTEGSVFPPHSVIAGVPAKVIRERDCRASNRFNAWAYHRNAEFYRSGNYRAWEGAEYEAWAVAKRKEIAADLDLRHQDME